MMSGINAANNRPQNILSWDNAQQLAIISSDLKQKHPGLTRRISDLVTITTAPSTLACALNYCPDRNSYNLLLISKAFNHLGEGEYQVYPQRVLILYTDHLDLHL